MQEYKADGFSVNNGYEEWISDSAQLVNTENDSTVDDKESFNPYYQATSYNDDVAASGDLSEANLGFSYDSVDNDYITYSGGDKTVSSYSENQKIVLATDFQGIEADGGNFIVKSSSGQLTLQDVKGKFVTYCDRSSVEAAYSYLGDSVVSSYSSYSSVDNSYNSINASVRSTYGILLGGDSVNDMIYAGSGGSSLYGGKGGNDTLTGGDGYDEFVYKQGGGNDVILNASSTDFINLSDISLSQISSADVNLSGVTLGFQDGGSLNVQGNTSGITYQLSDGNGGTTNFAVNQLTSTWYTK